MIVLHVFSHGMIKYVLHERVPYGIQYSFLVLVGLCSLLNEIFWSSAELVGFFPTASSHIPWSPADEASCSSPVHVWSASRSESLHCWFSVKSCSSNADVLAFTLVLMYYLHRWSSDPPTRLWTSSLGYAVSPPRAAILWRYFSWSTCLCAISCQWIPQPVCSPPGEDFLIDFSMHIDFEYLKLFQNSLSAVSRYQLRILVSPTSS